MIVALRIVCTLLLGSALSTSLAAQAPAARSDVLASEGIDAAPPPGFPPFHQIRGHSGDVSRMYRSERGRKTILVSVLGPFELWSDSTPEARQRLLKMRSDERERGSGQALPDTAWADSTHLVRQAPVTGPDGRRGIERSYVSRTGSATIASITVVDERNAPDPASDPEILAFLDAARPRADAGPVNLLAREGIDVAPPPGFPAFMPFPDSVHGGSRLYRSRSGSRMIMVFVTEPFMSWGDDDLDGRRGVLRVMVERLEEDFAARAFPGMREDATHLWWQARTSEPGEHGISRVYMPRAGAPVIVTIFVADAAGAPDPAADPGILAFLDAARPWPDAMRQTLLVFREEDVSMVLPPGLVPPAARSGSPDGMRVLSSRSGNRYLWILIADNQDPASARWSVEQRVRHLHGSMSGVLRQHYAPRMDEQVYTRGQLAYNDVRFDRADQMRGVAGYGRIYTTLSGRHRMIAVMYFETDTARIADEAAIEDLLDSVGLRP